MSGGRRKLQGGGRLVPSPNGPVQQVRVHEPKGKQQGGRSVVMAASFSGPLPAPDVLRGYGEVIPGLDQKIVGWVEDETTHRRKIEVREMTLYERAVKWDGWLQLGGMFLHFALLAGLFAFAWFALSRGYEIAGTAAIIGAMAGAIAVFRSGSKRAKGE